MPVFARRMFAGAASTTSATLYTCTSPRTQAVVTSIAVVNTSASAQTYTLNIAGVAIASSTAIPANTTQYIDLRTVMQVTETITGLASATTVNFIISGAEIQ